MTDGPPQKPLAVAPSGTEPATDHEVIAAIRTVLWEALSGREMGGDRTLVGMVKRLVVERDEARENRRGEFDLRIQAEAALAALRSGTAPTTDRCWWCGGDYTVGTHSMEFGCNGEARVLSRDTETP